MMLTISVLLGVADQIALLHSLMLYKLHGAFPATKSARLNISVGERYKDYKYQELVEELKRTRENTEQLLKDVGTE